MGNGEYMVKYSTYRYGTQPYLITSDVAGFPEQHGNITISNGFPGKSRDTDFKVGNHWYTDRPDQSLFYNDCQGAETVVKWRHDIFNDWGKRWEWIK